jgi:hypothetical protein
MQLLDQNDLAGVGNGGEGIALHAKNGRRTLFIAHESAPRNFTAVDVTDPRHLKVIATVDLPHAKVRSNSLSITGDIMAVAYQVAEPGLTPAGMELFDISDPAQPRSIGFFDTSGPTSRGAHYVWFVDGQYAYLSTGMPDFVPTHPLDDQIPVIVDVSDPTRPREVGRWWLPGTRQGDDAPPPVRHTRFDSGFKAHNVNVYPQRPDRCYVGYLDAGVIILDVSDKSRPRLVSRLDYHPPMVGFTHTVLPLFSRNLLAVTDESVRNQAEDYPKMLWFMDMSEETNPTILSTAPLPPVEEWGNRGGRYGAHNIHENLPQATSWYSEEIIVGAFFNCGIRAYDIRNPFRPEEVGSFVPPGPEGSPAGAIQMNDLHIDENGIIYAIDRFKGGLYTIEFTPK